MLGLPKLNATGNDPDRGRVDVGIIYANTPARSLNFVTLDRNLNRQLNTPGRPSLAGPHIGFIPALPRFSAPNPEAYFQVIELIFENLEVTTERATFSTVVSSLSHEQDVFDKVADIIRTPNPCKPYSVLKIA